MSDDTKISIPFHRAAVGAEEADAASVAIKSGWLTMGPKTFEFECEFAKYVGVKQAVAVATGTAALHLSLDAARVQPGDEVLVPTNTFTATAEVVTYVGAKPVLVDIDGATMNFSVEDAERRITSRTSAIIPVHIAGQPCDMDTISDLARKRGLTVIEDAAHALPSSYGGRRVGTISEFTCFSFYATKTLTTGEGGMVTTNDGAFAERIRLMRLHGIERDAWKRYRGDGSWYYRVLKAGYKYNLTDIQSAIGLVQLRKCDAMRDDRKRIALRYDKAFAPIDELTVPTILPDRETSWHLYILRLRSEKLSIGRDDFIRALQRRGVMCSVHFIPLHLQPFYQESYGYKVGDFPVAEENYRSSVSLPIYPSLTDEEVEHVIEAVRQTVFDGRHARVAT